MVRKPWLMDADGLMHKLWAPWNSTRGGVAPPVTSSGAQCAPPPSAFRGSEGWWDRIIPAANQRGQPADIAASPWWNFTLLWCCAVHSLLIAQKSYWIRRCIQTPMNSELRSDDFMSGRLDLQTLCSGLTIMLPKLGGFVLGRYMSANHLLDSGDNAVIQTRAWLKRKERTSWIKHWHVSMAKPRSCPWNSLSVWRSAAVRLFGTSCSDPYPYKQA